MHPVVVDASVLVAAVMDTGAPGDWARGVTAERHLLAPQLAPVEAGNVLRRAELARDDFQPEGDGGLPGHRRPSDRVAGLRAVRFLRIWELRLNLTTYDAWYVACAEALAVPLATLDARLGRAPGPSCRFLMPDHSPGLLQGTTVTRAFGRASPGVRPAGCPAA